jgi:hypothetical protein
VAASRSGLALLGLLATIRRGYAQCAATRGLQPAAPGPTAGMMVKRGRQAKPGRAGVYVRLLRRALGLPPRREPGTPVVDTGRIGHVPSRPVTVGRRPAFLLLAIALVAVLGHACVVPTSAHAASHASPHPIAPDHGTGGAHHHAPGGSPAHVASCDVVGTPSVQAPAMSLGYAVAWADVSIPTGQARPDVAIEVRSTGTSPPLFLLHSALLI